MKVGSTMNLTQYASRMGDPSLIIRGTLSLKFNITRYIIQYEMNINFATEEEFQLKHKQEFIHHNTRWVMSARRTSKSATLAQAAFIAFAHVWPKLHERPRSNAQHAALVM